MKWFIKSVCVTGLLLETQYPDMGPKKNHCIFFYHRRACKQPRCLGLHTTKIMVGCNLVSSGF